MTVKQHKARGYFYVDTTWPDGIRTRPRQPDEETAILINKKIEVACSDENRIWKRLRKELRLEGGKGILFRDFCDLYARLYVATYNRCQRSKKSGLKILKEHFGSKPLDAITPHLITEFIASRKLEEVSNKTVNRNLSALSHAMSWAKQKGHLEENPCEKIERLEEVDWVGHRPDEWVIDEVFAKLDPWHVPVYQFLRETGCRRNEAITLDSSQIDFARAQVVFHRNTKNGHSRQVPLTESALCAIAALPKHGNTVFYNPATLRPWSGDGVAIPWERARKRAGHDWLRLHDLRHAYGIKLAEAGCPMHYISEVLGHYSIDFTRRVYARFSPDSAAKTVLRVLQGRKAASSSESR